MKTLLHRARAAAGRLAFRKHPARPAPDRVTALSPRRDRAAIAAAIPVAVVALMAGKVSYTHITALGLRTHQGWTDSHLLAVPIDGLIVGGSVILAAGSLLGWLGVVPGIAATLFANLQYGLPHGALSAAVSTWPAIAFSVATFMLERWLKSQAGRGGQAAVQSAQAVPRDKLDAAIQAMIATAQAGNPLSGRQITARFELRSPVAGKVRELVLASMNGQANGDADE